MLDPIEALLKDREAPLCVKHGETVSDALVQMVEHDYSQLPVVDERGNLTGIISEQSITRQYYHIGDSVSLLDLSVDHCQEEAVTLAREDTNLFEILERLKNSYAVVVVSQYKPVGIVTDYDTTHFFRNWSEGLIRVQNVELTLRQYIEDVLDTEDALTAALLQAMGSTQQSPTKPRKPYEKFSFHDHIKLITHKRNWPKFEPYFKPQELFYHLMLGVNQARNQLAHFRGGLDSVQSDALRRAQQWLTARPQVKRKSKLVAVTEVKVTGSESKGKYAPLQEWLSAQAQEISSGHDIQRTFAEIESLIGNPLPPTAREHRAWWSNDSTSPHRQSMAWLRAGWRVENIDLTNEVVTFRRTDAVLYQIFFADLLERLKEKRPSLTRAQRTSAQNWFSFSGGRTGFEFGWSVPQGDRLIVYLYINPGDRDMNKRAYDLLLADKQEIDQQVGQPMLWDRRDQHKGSQISVVVADNVNLFSLSEDVEPLKETALQTMLRFVDVIQPRIKRLNLE